MWFDIGAASLLGDRHAGGVGGLWWCWRAPVAGEGEWGGDRGGGREAEEDFLMWCLFPVLRW